MTRKLIVRRFAGSLLFLIAGVQLPASPTPASTASIVFQIGTFDRSSSEFAADPPARPVNFIIGTSTPGKDWYATQQAASTAAGSTSVTNESSSPWAVTFFIEQAPAKAYNLHVALLLGTRSDWTAPSPRVPALRIGVNGKHGQFYLEPELDYGAGDIWGSFNPIYSHADVLVHFPGNYLHQGANTITFQAVEQASIPGLPGGLTYDAIELSSAVAAIDPQKSSARITPTVFYQRQTTAADRLMEVVEVFIRYNESVKPSNSVDLVVAGKAYHQSLHGGQDFGEERLEFSVPDFPKGTLAQIFWNVAGHRQHVEQSIDPGKKWTLFLVPQVHLDIGYTDSQANVAATQSRVLDEAMDFTKQHQDFRFSTDGEWNIEQFMKTRTPAEQSRLLAAIQKQQIFIPAQYANLLTGFPTAETLIRSLYPSADFSRINNSPFDFANITDVPSYSWSYASILASAGIHYFIAASNNYRAPVLLQGHLNEDSPMWWEGPDGKRVLFWYSRHYMQEAFLFGQPAALSPATEALPLFLKQFEHPSYRASAAIIFGTQGENTDLFPQQAELVGQWNKLYAYPRLQYSGFHDALENIADQFGGDLPTIRGDGGPYWEDGFASDAYYAAMERENEGRAPSAEKLETLTSFANPRLSPDKAYLDQMWRDMVLMDEHTFTSSDSVSNSTSAQDELAVKNQFATKAQALIDWLARNSMESIAYSISAEPGSLIVFNTLNWKRSGLVTIDLGNDNEIVDASNGQSVPYEVVSRSNAFRRVRFEASDVPPVGYKVFLMRPAEKRAEPAVASKTTALESPYYRVQLDPATGAVQSIFDKQLGRELVNQVSPYRFGQYLYVSGGDKQPNSLLSYGTKLPRPDLEVNLAHGGSLISVVRTPYGWSARMRSTDANTTEIVTEIRLFNQEKKLEFVEDVEKKEVDSKEAVYFAFPFAMDHPRFQYEIQSAVVNPEKDMYTGAGYEWFSVQHWVSVEQGGASGTVMPLDASLVTLGDINRGEWPTEFGTRPGTIFSYVMNNYWDTNFPAGQGGHFRFRYVVTSAPSTNPSELSRMGWEEMTPLEEDEAGSGDKVNLPRALDGKQGSFLQLDDPNVLLETWKPAEDGNGTIMRFLDLGGAERTATVQLPYLALSQAWETDAVERNQEPLSLVGDKGLRFSIRPHEIVTVRIVGAGTLEGSKK